jgi:hypothetical protein
MILLADLKVELDIDAGETAFDAYLSAIEPRAVAYVEARTARYFGVVQDTTEYLVGGGNRKLWLDSIPSTNPTSIKEREYPGATEITITPLADDGYVVRSEVRSAWLVRKGGYVWQSGYEYETVGLKRGYAAGDEPGEIRQLVIDLIASRLAMREAGGAGVQSETIGGYSYRLGDFSDGDLSSLGPMAMDTIALWRRPVYA